ncbi:protein phosphatase 2A inhibitor 2 [Rhodotorula diobovata]|uniref:Protein phosphatase 2A inhibitor 2 n=1 Tax=Rhodotorula diobovata TaxID=5288 RepID=A0A5C5G1M5_9BASI|nr:protein phosphatase 2A inhibitor 2 [Rhodotorula diobovata]
MTELREATRLDFLRQAFGESVAQDFEQNLDDIAKAHFEAYKLKLEQQKPIFKKRAELAAKVKDFWFTALENCGKTAQFIDAVDEEALKALKDVWIEHSADDVREYEIRFTFGKNPYFKNTTLVKKLTLQPPADLADKADTPKPFDLDVPVYLADKTPIDWTSPDHDLTKKAPRSHADEREEFDEFEGPGSFFNWFGETGEDRTSLAEVLVEWWAHATEYAAGLTPLDDDESGAEFGFDSEFDDDESEDEDPKKEIDLDDEEKKRPKKKQRK